MAKGPKWDKGSVFLELTPDKRLQAIFFRDGYSGMVQGPPVNLSRHWHTLSIVWERKKAMIYLDGKQYAISGLSKPFQPDFKTLHLGADHQNNFPAPAQYDDLMIFQARSVKFNPQSCMKMGKGYLLIGMIWIYPAANRLINRKGCIRPRPVLYRCCTQG